MSWGMSEKQNIVTIDGPAGVGKSTVSKRVAALMGFTYLDTGAMYRGVGLHLQNESVDLTDNTKIRKVLEELDLQLVSASSENEDVGIVLNGVDVSTLIRRPEMAMTASVVSAIPVVREILTKLQKDFGAQGKIVAEGRDTGTVVFPRAQFKFFLDADPRERANRRVAQLREKGEQADFDEMLSMIVTRDKNDSERAIAPLKQAVDAIRVDTTKIAIDQVVEQIMTGIRDVKNGF